MYLTRPCFRNVFLIFPPLFCRMYMAYTICIVGLEKARCECLEKDFVLLPKTLGKTVEIRFGNSPTTFAFLMQPMTNIAFGNKCLSVFLLFIYFSAASKLFINFSRILALSKKYMYISSLNYAKRKQSADA